MIGTAEQHVVSPFLAADLAVAKCVTKGHEDLTVGGIAVVPGDPEVGSGNAETLQGFIGAVWSGNPVDKRCRRPRDGGGGRGCGLRRRLRCRLRRGRGPVWGPLGWNWGVGGGRRGGG